MQFFGPLMAFAVTALLIVALRPVAIAVGLVDIPSGRKAHTGHIPLIGGMAIFIAATLALSYQCTVVDLPLIEAARLPAFFAAAVLLVGVGAWDDYVDLPPSVRLLAQIAAALIMVYGGGVVLTDLGNLSPTGGLLVLGFMAVPFTVFACIGVINAMNMCDGLDGLSGSLALIALLGLGIANALWGSAVDQQIIVVLSACVIGFLLFNLRTLWRERALVFLGDAGSMLLGISLCWLAIKLSQGEDRVISPAAALWFLMMPIYDAVSMMLRRVLRGQSPFSADREHLHHIFMLAGFTVGESVTLMCGLAVLGVLIGLGGTYFAVPDLALAGGFAVGGGLYYWVIRRAWRVMRFLRRSICRRAGTDRRAGIDRRVAADPAYAGPERRSGGERRRARTRRTADLDS